MEKVAEGFYNIRGSFKVFGVIDVGTHSSLIRLTNGKFLMIDCIELPPAVVTEIASLTSGGKDIEAIANVHPFHTASVRSVHARYPDAKLYGTQRHKDILPDLPWQSALTESEGFKDLFKDDIDTSVPAGTQLVVPNSPSVHFGSVLVYHRASKTVHSDDTFSYMRHVPFVLRVATGMSNDTLTLHRGLAKALEPRADAASDFRAWAENLPKMWDIENMCTAHMNNLLARENLGKSFAERISEALAAKASTLEAHEAKHGGPKASL
mmetsp:Transcript_7125/g.19089  ORF Transcript_7125/g.19089 Transcript_7125/m.19089 type:complete len:266 (-) Transcript_7125:125-922(-)